MFPPQKATGDDFLVEDLIASFAAGETEACVEFVIRNDILALEGDEIFTVDFSPPEGILPATPTTSTVTVIDDDGIYAYFI